MDQTLFNSYSELLEDDWMINSANSAAFFYENIKDINWVGFYFYRDGILKLGPFQGKVACTRISLDRGVCGFTAKKGTLTNVADVHEFPGHIACDAASRSELVIPLFEEGRLIGVLDVDSPSIGRFTKAEEDFFSQCMSAMMKKSKFPAW